MSMSGDGTGAHIASLAGRNLAQRLRLLSGLTLLAFAVTHLANHALGIISLDAMLAGQRVIMLPWRSLPGTALLLAAGVTHLALVLHKQIVRPTLRMPWVEAVRLLLGVVTLNVLFLHATPMIIHNLTHTEPASYPEFLVTLTLDSWVFWNQMLLVTAAWAHGCMGLHLWLRLRAWYRMNLPALVTLAVLLPVLALLGVLNGARESRGRLPFPPPPAAAQAQAAMERQSIYALYAALSLQAGAAALRLGVQALRRRRGQVSVRYPGGRQAQGFKGSSVLDISRMGGIPHAAVCGGRGRCSTCRVHVDAGWEHLPPPQEAERRILQRIKAPERVRLACQLCPLADLAVTPLVPANARARDALPYGRMLFGTEQEVVVLFADLRGFTRLSEGKLPYDVVHILNQYFAEMGEVIEAAGGYLDKFIGDGIMALFGLRDGAHAGAVNALNAAKAMGARLEVLNARLAMDLPQPLRLGIGIHAGPAIVGEMGYKRATSLTAIGDTVNVASRLESATKIAGCQLIVSAQAARQAGVDLSAFPLRRLKVRGREEVLLVHLLPLAAQLPALSAARPLPGGGVSGGAARPVG
jgi:adenylate cyclase